MIPASPFGPDQTKESGNKTPEPLMCVENLSLDYRGKTALERVNLLIPRRRITAIVGPSGCGKTSLLTSLNRLTDLIPWCRVSGRIRMGVQDILAPETDVLQLRRRIGMIFQKPAPFPFSIRKNIELPLKEHGLKDRRQRAEIVESVLRDVGLWDEVKDRMHHPARTLSGGQQQRLCIARALALKPEALLMDEPCSALDPISSRRIETLILDLKKRHTLVIVTHDPAQAKHISDYTAFFGMGRVGGPGKLIEHGPTDRVFQAPENALTAAYITGGKASSP